MTTHQLFFFASAAAPMAIFFAWSRVTAGPYELVTTRLDMQERLWEWEGAGLYAPGPLRHPGAGVAFDRCSIKSFSGVEMGGSRGRSTGALNRRAARRR